MSGSGSGSGTRALGSVGHTRAALREDVARFFAGSKTFESTATGGTTTTVVDTKLARFANDYLNGVNVFLKTDAGGAHAAPEGEQSWATDFVASTGTVSCSPAFTVAPANGDTYQLYWRVGKDDINRALARACVGATALLSLTPSNTTLDYTLSAATLLRSSQINAVWRRDLVHTDLLPYELQGCQLEDNAGVLTLRLPDLCHTGDSLWVEYTVGENGMTADTDMVNLPAPLVKARALVILLENMLSQLDANELQTWGSILREWKEERQRMERATPQPAGRARRFRWEDTVGYGYSRAEWALGLVPHK